MNSDTAQSFNPTWISAFVAVAALIISLVSLWRTRRYIDVEFGSTMKSANIFYKSVEDCRTNSDPLIFPASYICSITVINPCLHDIGYFHVGVFGIADDGTRHEIKINTYFNSDKTYIRNEKEILQISPVSNTYGVLKSQSYNKIYIMSSQVSGSYKSIEFTFSIAKESFYRFFDISGHINKYKTYCRQYDVENDTIDYHS